MKNILLIIALFISWNAVAEEKTWFCSSEKSGGLIYENNSWKTGSFKAKRMTVKQQDDTLSFSDHYFKRLSSDCKPTYSDMIQCNGYSSMFVLNTKNGLATSAVIYGWLSGEEDGNHDTLNTSVWRCESF